MKILVTNLLGRKTFDVINIIRINYNDSNIIYAGDVSARKCKFIYGSINFHLLREDYFDEDLNNISGCYKGESIVYLPIEENITMRFYDYIERYGERNFNYMLPSFDSYHLSRNKNELNVFCEVNHIPCPKYYSEKNIRQANYNLPLILKPINGSGSEGIRFIKSQADLKLKGLDFKINFFQELLDNPKDIVAGFFLCDEGEIVSFYSHKRIRTFPEHGGVSVFSKGTSNLKIKSAGTKIIKKLNWSGFIMIEFLEDLITNEYKIIEINPRLWGSILLSEFNNSNFIGFYIELCRGSKIEDNIVLTNKYIRWIFPYDIIYFIKHPKNPFTFFKTNGDTCYINFTYSTLTRSLKFIILSYFDYTKVRKKLYG